MPMSMRYVGPVGTGLPAPAAHITLLYAQESYLPFCFLEDPVPLMHQILIALT